MAATREARRLEEKAALRPVLASMKEAGHDPQPPHRAEFYGDEFLIVCRCCGANVKVTLTRLPSRSSDTGYCRVAEVTYDSATAIECRGERSYA